MRRDRTRRGRPLAWASALTSVVVMVLATTALAACTAPAPAPSQGTEPQPLKVVASIDVYGDIAKQLGGDRVEVTSLIDNPAIDPHDFEADARAQLAISKADVIIQNGGGYDDFMTPMIEASSNMRAVLLRAVTLSRHSGDRDNEHVWFDVPSMRNLADGITDALIQSDRAGTKTYRANSARFSKVLDALESRASRVANEHSGAPVMVTEPVPLYLLATMGLKNVTPEDFLKAADGAAEVPAAVMLRAHELIETGDVALLVYNEQSGGPVTDSLVAAAKERGIATIAVTETLPKDLNYQQWMTVIIGEVGAALDARAATDAPQSSESPVSSEPSAPTEGGDG